VWQMLMETFTHTRTQFNALTHADKQQTHTHTHKLALTEIDE